MATEQEVYNQVARIWRIIEKQRLRGKAPNFVRVKTSFKDAQNFKPNGLIIMFFSEKNTFVWSAIGRINLLSAANVLKEIREFSNKEV